MRNPYSALLNFHITLHYLLLPTHRGRTGKNSLDYLYDPLQDLIPFLSCLICFKAPSKWHWGRLQNGPQRIEVGTSLDAYILGVAPSNNVMKQQ